MNNFTKKERLLIGHFAQGEARRIKHSNPVSPAYAEMRQNRLPVCESIMKKLRNGDKLITPEWLESVGVIRQKVDAWVVKIRASDPISLVAEFWEDGPRVLLVVGRAVGIIHIIKTRHQFRELYRLLSGKELGGE